VHHRDQRGLVRDDRLHVIDLHHAYKDAIALENESRDAEGRRNKLKPMTYPSFASLVNKAKRLGYIEVVREEELTTEQGRQSLKSLRKVGNRVVVVDAKRVVYGLNIIILRRN